MEEVENHKSLLGFGTIFRLKAVRFLTALTLLFLFAQGLAEIAIPVYSQKTLGAGAAGYGLLMSAFGVGSLSRSSASSGRAISNRDFHLRRSLS